MNDLLAWLNAYSNLLLVIITIVYAFLTWRMVLEMRHAREAENEPQLVATLVPISAKLVHLRISNAGRGPALNIHAKMRLDSSTKHEEVAWSHPVLLSNAHEDFRPPGDTNNRNLDILTSTYDRVVVEMEWLNTFKHRQHSMSVINLKRLLDGWTRAGWLLPPAATGVELGKMKDELSKIASVLQNEDRRRTVEEFGAAVIRGKTRTGKRKKQMGAH